MEVTNQRQFALSYALLMYMVGVVLLITLIPFQFHIPHEISDMWGMYVDDSITNFVLFLPLGFLFQLSRRRNSVNLKPDFDEYSLRNGSLFFCITILVIRFLRIAKRAVTH